MNHPKKPVSILGLSESEPDIFIDIFQNDFSKVIKAFALKKLNKSLRPPGHRISIRRGELISTFTVDSPKKASMSPSVHGASHKEEFLTVDDFAEISEEGDCPDIVSHIIWVLTDTNIKANQAMSINEIDHKPRYPTLSQKEEFGGGKSKINVPLHVRKMIMNCFFALWGRKPSERVPGSTQDGFTVLTERNFTQNFKLLLGFDCPFFGKMFYLLLA